MKNGLSEVLKSINSVDKTLGIIEKHVDKMKNQLEMMVKEYPPFPPGSEERIRILRNYNAVRKLIDQLTIPPRKYFNSESMTVENKMPGEKPAVGKPDIPKLAPDSTDNEISASIEKLKAAKTALQRNRKELKDEVNALNFFRYTS